MAISLTDNIRIGQQKPVDDKYFNGFTPYTSTDEANSLISSNVRHRGLTVNIDGEEYWYKDGTGNGDLVLKIINSTALDDKLNKGTYSGTAQDLKTLIDSVSQNLQNETSSRVNADLLKQDKLSSYDESILIEGGNIEGNVSLFQEYFEQQECELNFTPIQIIGVYLNGIKQKPSLYTIIPPKTISVTNFVTNDYIEIQYTKLKI